MRLDRRFSSIPRSFEPEMRWIERANELTEVLAPPHWTTARVEAWLDWADDLPGDVPDGTPEALSPEAACEPLLAGGPDRYARRLAAWGLALGVFGDAAAAELFRDELFAALAEGVIATGRQLPFGARVNPLVPDPARPPPRVILDVADRAFAGPARALRAGRGLAATLGGATGRRLQAVAEAVLRCEGDVDACASLDVNQALARAAWAAKDAGAPDAAIAAAIALGRAGLEVEIAQDAAPKSALIAACDRAAAARAGDAAVLAWETSALTLAFADADAERLALLRIAPKGVVNVLAFDGAGGFDTEGFATAVRLAFLALDLEARTGFVADPADAHWRHDARPVGLALAGVAEFGVGKGLGYDADGARSLAGEIHARAAEETRAASAGLGGGKV